MTLPPDAIGIDFSAFYAFTFFGHALENATNALAGVTITAGTNSTTTDTNGFYILSNIPWGTNAITVSALPVAGGTVSGGGNYNSNANVTVTAEVVAEACAELPESQVPLEERTT